MATKMREYTVTLYRNDQLMFAVRVFAPNAERAEQYMNPHMPANRIFGWTYNVEVNEVEKACM